MGEGLIWALDISLFVPEMFLRFFFYVPQSYMGQETQKDIYCRLIKSTINIKIISIQM